MEFANTFTYSIFHKDVAKFKLVTDKEVKMECLRRSYLNGYYHPRKKMRVHLDVESKLRQQIAFLSKSCVAPSIGKMINEEFTQNYIWEVIKTDYNYMMNDYLVKLCKETKKELSKISLRPASSSLWTCAEFVKRFNTLHDRIHVLFTIANKEVNKGDFLKTFGKKIEKLKLQCQELKQQSVLLDLRHPELRDDIFKRCNIIDNKWKAMETTINTNKHEKKNIFKKISHEVKEIRAWIRRVNEELTNLTVTEMHSKEQMLEAQAKQKALQREIETRGRVLLTSLFSRCEELLCEGATVETRRVRRSAQVLERSWHGVWLRSLEALLTTEERIIAKQSSRQSKPVRESRESEVDEGPVAKYRRLTFDPYVIGMDHRVSTVEKSSAKDSDKPSVCNDGKPKTGSGSSFIGGTRDVGIHCNVHRDLIPANDKCVMVGTTGIAALKAEYGDDFTNFEIIQDVGYSSESSTHLSSDDVSEHIRIYSYSPPRRTDIFASGKCSELDLSEELAKVTVYSLSSVQRGFGHNSLGSSSSASHNDSGFGTMDSSVLCDGESEVLDPDEIIENRLGSPVGRNPSDFSYPSSEDNIDYCLPFSDGGMDTADPVNLDFDGSDFEGQEDTLTKRRSFNESTQEFYKMTSVDSDNGDIEPTQLNTEKLNKLKIRCSVENVKVPEVDDLSLSVKETGGHLTCDNILINNHKIPEYEVPKTTECNLFNDFGFLAEESITESSISSDASDSFVLKSKYPKPRFSSSPKDCCTRDREQPFSPSRCHPQRIKRRGCLFDFEPTADSYDVKLNCQRMARAGRVRKWLKRCPRTSSICDDYKEIFTYDSVSKLGDSHHMISLETESLDSSCDASSEYTTTNSESDGEASSVLSEDFDASCTLSASGMDSIETVVPAELDVFGKAGSLKSTEPMILLPPPPPPTPPNKSREERLSNSSKSFSDDSDFSVHRNRSSTLKAASEGSINGLSLRFEAQRITENNDALSTTETEQITRSRFTDLFGVAQNQNSLKNRLHVRSLPTILRNDSSPSDPSSDQSGHRLLTRKKYSSFTSPSEVQKPRTRRRKRSSSSSYSLTAPSTYHRTQTARKRHWSQSNQDEGSFTNFSTCYSKEKLPIDVCSESEGQLRNVVLSPDSDVVCTQLEEQSTTSEQVWDGYQDMPYLSEAYSEPTVDEDALRKLTEFGDDYCSVIGSNTAQNIDCNQSSSSNPSSYSSRSLAMSKPVVLPQAGNVHIESDSDAEDLDVILIDTCKTLQFARSTFMYSHLTPSKYADLVATCQTHLSCLRDVVQHIHIDGKKKIFSENDLEHLYTIIKEWEILQSEVEMSQKAEGIQDTIQALYKGMSELLEQSKVDTTTFTSWEQVKQKLSLIQMALTTLLDIKEQDLLTVNLRVHHLTIESGSTSSSLKESVTKLYQLWDDAYEENGAQLSNLQALCHRWQNYENNFAALTEKVQKQETHVCHMSDGDADDSKTVNCTEDDIASLEKEMDAVKKEASFLENCLKGGALWVSIDDGLRELNERVLKIKRSVATEKEETIARNVHLQSSEDEANKDGISEEVVEDSSLVASTSSEVGFKRCGADSDSDDYESKLTPSKGSRFWRVFRTAIPIQIAVVLLYCLACALEPHCCDVLNNFNFSLTPQLRYIRGPPPV